MANQRLPRTQSIALMLLMLFGGAAAAQESILENVEEIPPPAGTVVEPTQIILDDSSVGSYVGAEVEWIDEGSCDCGHCSASNSSTCCPPAASSCTTCRSQFCICLPTSGWFQAEYLHWYPSGMNVPALLTTSPDGTQRGVAGVLDQPLTSILYGDEELLDGDLSGLRLRFGTWLNLWPGLGIEGEYVLLDETENFFRESDGSPILTRPFLNALDGGEDARLVAFPETVLGSVLFQTKSQFEGAAFRFRQNLCGAQSCQPGWLDCRTAVPTSSQIAITLGYRFWELDEAIFMHEQLQQISELPNRFFDVRDNFETKNQFNGLEIGVDWQAKRGWWTLDAMVRMSIGNVRQTVDIFGNTDIRVAAASTESATGFLTQRSNIGSYTRDEFMIVPEVGLTAGRQLTQRMRLTLGYSAVYLGNVVRPGDHVSTELNPNLLTPEAVPFAGPLRPAFEFNESDYFVHGLNLGAVYNW